MSEVRLVGIEKYYEGSRATRPAIEHLDLAIPGGELAVLVGPSGCGKSTTLRIVAGLEDPTAGQVFIGDRDVTRVPPAQRDIAMVFQSYALYPHMTVRENMAFALKIRKRPEAEIRERVDAAARSLDIEAYLDRRPKALSGGQRQRVAIGRAVVREPKVFLFDEPLSNLDAKLRGEMRREIARIHAQSSATSLYVTHDQVEAMTLADRIVVLDAGAVQQVGSPGEIYGAPANKFVAGFFGTPAMNFLSAELSGQGGALAATGPGFSLALPLSDTAVARTDVGPDVILGIRPESIALAQRPGAVSMKTEVTLREVLGAEVILYLDSEAGALTIRADAREDASAARPGEHVTVWMHHDSVHLFDAETGSRL